MPGDTTVRFLKALSTLSVIASFYHIVDGALPIVLWDGERTYIERNRRGMPKA